MEYSFIRPAVNSIIEKAFPTGGWASHTSPKVVSRTVTGQVIITLSKSINHAPAGDKEQINATVQNGLRYLKENIPGELSIEITTYVFAILAHLEHHRNFPELQEFDTDFIKLCYAGLLKKEYYHYDDDLGFSYDKGGAKFLGNYVALEAWLQLLPFAYNDSQLLSELGVEGILTNEELKDKIDQCFKYLIKQLQDAALKINNGFDDDVTQKLALGITISFLYQTYRAKFCADLNSSNICLADAIEYFNRHLETDVFQNWCLEIRQTRQFNLLYISNLFSGLLKYRDDRHLKEPGIKLLHKLGKFICTSRALNDYENDNFLQTKVRLNEFVQSPVWATAHCLNAMLKMHLSVPELECIVEGYGQKLAGGEMAPTPFRETQQISTLASVPRRIKILISTFSVILTVISFSLISVIFSNWQSIQDFAVANQELYFAIKAFLTTISGIALTILGFIVYTRMLKVYPSKKNQSNHI